MSGQEKIKQAGGGQYLPLNNPNVPQAYLDAMLKYGTEKQIAMVNAYKTKYQKMSKARSTYRKRQSVKKPVVKMNAWLKEIVRAYGATLDETTYPGFNPSSEQQTPETPISHRFFDTAIFSSASSEGESENRIKCINKVLGTTQNPVKIKFLPGNGGWLVNLANIPVENCLKLFTNADTCRWILNIDYTQDFAGFINIPVTQKINELKRPGSFIEDREDYIEYLQAEKGSDLQMKYEKDGVLFKGVYRFTKRNTSNQPIEVRYKFYDKINSFVCNTGINSVGLTLAKSLTEPREPHIQNYLNSEDFEKRSISRIEITLNRNTVKNRDEIFDEISQRLSHCYCQGDMVEWFEKILYPNYPTVVIDLRKLCVSTVEDPDSKLNKNARWAWEYVDDNFYQGYKGGIVVAYYIEGYGAQACIQGFVMNDLDKALQKCVGNRGITLVTVHEWDGSHDVTYFKTDSRFKPTPTRADDYHNIRGAGKTPPKCLEHLWLWCHERKVVTPRKIEEGNKWSVIDTVKPPSRPRQESQTPPLPSTAKKLILATHKSYVNCKTIHTIVDYNVVDGYGVFSTPSGTILKTKNISPFPNPKFFNSVTGNYQKSR